MQFDRPDYMMPAGDAMRLATCERLVETLKDAYPNYEISIFRANGDTYNGILIEDAKNSINLYIPSTMLPKASRMPMIPRALKGWCMPKLIEWCIPEQAHLATQARVCIAKHSFREGGSILTLLEPSQLSQADVFVIKFPEDAEKSNNYDYISPLAIVLHKDWAVIPIGFSTLYTSSFGNTQASEHYINECRRLAKAYFDIPNIVSYQSVIRPQITKKVPADKTATAPKPRYSPSNNTYSSLRFSDKLSNEGSYVIDIDGKMLKPAQVESYLDIYDAEVAQLETWTNLPADCIILYWRRTDPKSDFETSVICRQPQSVSIQQGQRILLLQKELEQEWKVRCTNFSLPDAQNKCAWLEQMKDQTLADH